MGKSGVSRRPCATEGCSQPIFIAKYELCRKCYSAKMRWSRELPLGAKRISARKFAEMVGCTPRKVDKMKEYGQLPCGGLTEADAVALRERWSLVIWSDAEHTRKAFDWTTTHCIECGQEFHRKPSQALGFQTAERWRPPKRLCSVECHHLWRSKQPRQWVVSPDGTIRRRSEMSLWHWIRSGSRKWVVWPDGTVVSKRVAETQWRIGKRRCTNCQKQFHPVVQHHHYCSRHCKKNHRNGVHRARASGAAVVHRIGKLDVLRRDNWTCHLCGERIDNNLQSPDPMAGTVDHLIPLSQGGTHTWDNLAAAHMRCNSVKGNRLTVPSLIYTTKQQNDAVPIMTLF